VARLEGDTFMEIVGALQPQQHIAVLALDPRNGDTGYVQVVTREERCHAAPITVGFYKGVGSEGTLRCPRYLSLRY
jgi:hypothetical protein